MSALVIAGVSFLTGTIGGWWLTMVVVTASISFSQERMERKVRYWQAETAPAIPARQTSDAHLQR